MELGKVPSSTEKGKGQKKPKEGEGDRFEETKKERKKQEKKKRKQARKQKVDLQGI